MPSNKKSPLKRKRSNDSTFLQEEKKTKRCRLSSLSSLLNFDKLIRSAKRRLAPNSSNRSTPVTSVNFSVTFNDDTTLSDYSKSHKRTGKRQIDQVLDDSFEEVVICGKPVNKKQKKGLSDSMIEDFYLSEDDADDDESATGSDVDISIEDVFSYTFDDSFEKPSKSPVKLERKSKPGHLSVDMDNQSTIRVTSINVSVTFDSVKKKHQKEHVKSIDEEVYRYDDDVDGYTSDLSKDEKMPISKTIHDADECLKSEFKKNSQCTLDSCKKHSNSTHPESCSQPFQECRNRTKPVVCETEIEQLERACEESKKIFNLYSTESDTIVKKVDFGNGRSPSVYLYGKALLTLCKKQLHTLHVERSFSLGNCYVTMFVFRNTNFVDTNSKRKYSPMMLGPVMLHFDTDGATYKRFFDHVKQCADIQYDFKPCLDRKLKKKDNVMNSATKSVFGTCVSICDIHHQPGHIRNTLRANVQCRDPLSKVIEVITSIMNGERDNYVRSLENGSAWKLVPRAQDYMVPFMDEPCRVAYLDVLSLSPE